MDSHQNIRNAIPSARSLKRSASTALLDVGHDDQFKKRARGLVDFFQRSIRKGKQALEDNRQSKIAHNASLTRAILRDEVKRKEAIGDELKRKKLRREEQELEKKKMEELRSDGLEREVLSPEVMESINEEIRSTYYNEAVTRFQQDLEKKLTEELEERIRRESTARIEADLRPELRPIILKELRVSEACTCHLVHDPDVSKTSGPVKGVTEDLPTVLPEKFEDVSQIHAITQTVQEFCKVLVPANEKPSPPLSLEPFTEHSEDGKDQGDEEKSQATTQSPQEIIEDSSQTSTEEAKDSSVSCARMQEKQEILSQANETPIALLLSQASTEHAEDGRDQEGEEQEHVEDEEQEALEDEEPEALKDEEQEDLKDEEQGDLEDEEQSEGTTQQSQGLTNLPTIRATEGSSDVSTLVDERQTEEFKEPAGFDVIETTFSKSSVLVSNEASNIIPTTYANNESDHVSTQINIKLADTKSRDYNKDAGCHTKETIATMSLPVQEEALNVLTMTRTVKRSSEISTQIISNIRCEARDEVPDMEIKKTIDRSSLPGRTEALNNSKPESLWPTPVSRTAAEKGIFFGQTGAIGSVFSHPASNFKSLGKTGNLSVIDSRNLWDEDMSEISYVQHSEVPKQGRQVTFGDVELEEFHTEVPKLVHQQNLEDEELPDYVTEPESDDLELDDCISDSQDDRIEMLNHQAEPHNNDAGMGGDQPRNYDGDGELNDNQPERSKFEDNSKHRGVKRSRASETKLNYYDIVNRSAKQRRERSLDNDIEELFASSQSHDIEGSVPQGSSKENAINLDSDTADEVSPRQASFNMPQQNKVDEFPHRGNGPYGLDVYNSSGSEGLDDYRRSTRRRASGEDQDKADQYDGQSQEETLVEPANRSMDKKPLSFSQNEDDSPQNGRRVEDEDASGEWSMSEDEDASGEWSISQDDWDEGNQLSASEDSDRHPSPITCPNSDAEN
ncbi:hypothetical protein MMC12_001758 [Toensbergia leucococca]|nr:hypothetical protein [Toensbergia leucococca]